ncbi:ExbD/TolR family protein [Roseospira visakhapatnamensis]|uniref:Biopolymer transport protein ExbD n=1 Tax=Roseospira visakhapatnamensis TaxID=390880 RepID=A0A7W6RFE1_9PROT|nr:biopolymer transporter ExbD [Roseospira visakhapatnamensis]MBB4267046.1 biopolymer transport protein ExbD [Roseospira visakhapatnamensis]
MSRPAASSGPTPSPPGFDALTGTPRRRALVSLTPLIDVVFILLVFFMLASSFLDWRSIGLDTPTKGRGAPADAATTLLVDVEGDRLRLDGRVVTLDRIAGVVTDRLAADPDQRVLVRPATGVSLQRAVMVLDRLAGLGVTNIALRRAAAPQGGTADAF